MSGSPLSAWLQCPAERSRQKSDHLSIQSLHSFLHARNFSPQALHPSSTPIAQVCNGVKGIRTAKNLAKLANAFTQVCKFCKATYTCYGTGVYQHFWRVTGTRKKLKIVGVIFSFCSPFPGRTDSRWHDTQLRYSHRVSWGCSIISLLLRPLQSIPHIHTRTVHFCMVNTEHPASWAQPPLPAPAPLPAWNASLLLLFFFMLCDINKVNLETTDYFFI